MLMKYMANVFISVAVRFIPVCVLFFYLSNTALQKPPAIFFFHVPVLFYYYNVQLINLLHIFTQQQGIRKGRMALHMYIFYIQLKNKINVLDTGYFTFYLTATFPNGATCFTCTCTCNYGFKSCTSKCNDIIY